MGNGVFGLLMVFEKTFVASFPNFWLMGLKLC